MPFLKKIIFFLLIIISFSCQTQLEKQGWQRIAVVSKSDTSPTNKKDKELVVQKMHTKSSYYYRLSAFEKDSTGKIINRKWEWGFERSFNSDIAYYKWEYDSVCLVRFLNKGNFQASVKVSIINDSSEHIEILDEPKK